MQYSSWAAVLLLFPHLLRALRYDPAYVGYNLNENETATEPRDYWGSWKNHTYHASPTNWRFPFYTLTIDRFADGDPTNNDANGTVFEHNWMSNQFRFGGDVEGIYGNLDYIQGMGAKAIYMTGSMMINMPWSPDGYGPLDFTLLDQHHGALKDWRRLVNEIHRRGMYIIFDNTMATMGNLLGYAGKYLNTTVGFNFGEYDYVWKDTQRQYHDFSPGNSVNTSCQYPRIWEQNGLQEPISIMNEFHGCRASEFDMYGDIKDTGAYPSYINQLSRFASVQDRLREWQPSVLEKINVMSCMQIAMLDIDGFRMDKGVQTTIDAMAEFSDYQRQCAKRLGKDNFLMVGEVVADPRLGAIYYGRGKQPNQALATASEAIRTSNETDPDLFVRPFGMTALDGAAFHYDIYGSLTRFLGLDGPWGSMGVDWVELWNLFLKTHDMVNANTGLFDPRHMFGTTNQDVFRWPALRDGAQRQLLGMFVTILTLPGIPMVLYGEEQEFYLLENLAPDYVYGRTPMASSRAWQLHGCYNLGEELYVDMPYDKSGYGCQDDSVSLDHRDPSHPMLNILKRMFELRERYPVLNDGFNLTTLSSRVYQIHLPGSQGIPSPHGIWSVYRGHGEPDKVSNQDQPVWLLYHNENRSITYNFNCSSGNSSSPHGSLIAAFSEGIRVKNLFYPYDEYNLDASTYRLGLQGSVELNGCIRQLTLRPWEYKALVPINAWQQPKPVITRVVPGHDARLLSSVSHSDLETVGIQVYFSVEMDCGSVATNLLLESTTMSGQVARLNQSSVMCELVPAELPTYVGQVSAAWVFKANLDNVANGVHTYTIDNATTADGAMFTGARDKFMFRIGQLNNPMVFPISSNYTRDLLHNDPITGQLVVSPHAAGADKMRYSTNWGSSFSPWQAYTGENITIQKQAWNGTQDQEWDGEHVIMHYWSQMTGSSDHVQHTDLDRHDSPPRRWPHAWVEGTWNQWGFDRGITNKMTQIHNGEWTFDLFTEWPTSVTVSVWGMNPDGLPDKSATFGDVDRDGVLDWLPPDGLANNFINVSHAPPRGSLGHRLHVNDGNYSYRLVPCGSATVQLVVMVVLCVIPILMAILGVRIFMVAFYKVKFNRLGDQLDQPQTTPLLQKVWRPKFLGFDTSDQRSNVESTSVVSGTSLHDLDPEAIPPNRRVVLIATMEYEIEDWDIRIKIGGLGVMASLMGKSLTHQNLIWVVPCVSGIDYPLDTASRATAIRVSVMGQPYDIDVYYHVFRNITFVLLDAPVFRKRTKTEPYPPRMDDLESGIYYSAWNQCIAEAIRRFEPKIYHINDWHGAIAPLYLLPAVTPCCMSLHNAEFQGLWPMKTKQQTQDICRVFNLDEEPVKKYVQYGDVFNLLHAGASYLRTHQGGFGAVGVSKKYGGRALTRYPVFWGLHKIGALPNPDPTDTAPLGQQRELVDSTSMADSQQERERLRCEAQEWAGLDIDPKAELFVFVGRWSQQKGIDLIADVFLSVLEKHPKTQLICVGPVIDLYGKFAALKLAKLVAKYPGRVFSNPTFVTLPPCIFSGAEFALMPSRDEPFGLVAVEFGRKGALCVGSRVGGFGHMPGWWFTVEAVTSKHLLKQFRSAIDAALASKPETRAAMRASSVLQRFPVAQWVEDLEILQLTSIERSEKTQTRHDMPNHFRSWRSSLGFTSHSSSRVETPSTSKPSTPPLIPSPTISRANSVINLSALSEVHSQTAPPDLRTEHPRSLLSRYSHLPGVSENSSETASMQDVYLDGPTPRNAAPDGDVVEHAILRLSLTNFQDAQIGAAQGQSLTPVFTDPKQTYYNKFSKKLSKLNLRSSERALCIDEYIMDSEKDWFNKYHSASLRRGPTPKPQIPSFLSRYRKNNISGTTVAEVASKKEWMAEYDQYFGDDYKGLRGVRWLLEYKIGTWSIAYCLLAFGQIICANAYQLTLLTGAIGEPTNKLYALCSIYFVSSAIWWILYRRIQAVYVLSTPFLFFGLCFFLLGMSFLAKGSFAKGWIYDVASGLYTIGSSAGSMYFSLNFGTEGGTPSQTWAFRACVIGGTQQLLVAFLWYWGSAPVRTGAAIAASSLAPSPTTLTAVTIPLAVLMWAVGITLFFGLPDYYRQLPGVVPLFYRGLCRRGIVVWFWIMVLLQGFWLSGPYSRNWTFLWSSQNAPRWATAALIIFFFVFIWAALLAILGRLSKQHSWIIPIFAIGLICPRWCQMLWSISGIGFHIPWAGPVGGALVSRAVWLWLGVLDALQGVGFGMILLLTLTRLHITCALIVAQMLGAFIAVIARLGAPDRIGAGTVFPNIANGSFFEAWFVVGLVCQCVVAVGYLKFFRKAQLTKP